MVRCLVVLFAAVLPSWSTGGQSTAAAQTAPAADRVVVFPADQAATLLTQCSRQVPGPVQGTWVPDAPIVARIESVIEAALVQALKKTGPPAESRHPIREYYRQYGGLVVGGRRLVYVNAFHERHLELPARLRPLRAPVDWRKVAVNVCDGWVNYFGATYDVESGRVDTLTFNGRPGSTP